MKSIAWIGAGYTAQKFKRLYPNFEFIESHRDNLEAFEDRIEGDLTPFRSADFLVFSLPPRQAAIKLLAELGFKGRMILLSSIGVYQKESGTIDEDSKLGETERSKLIGAIEDKFLENDDAVVLRLGGLYDEDRHPLRFILKNNSQPKKEELINFVHIDDVCSAVHTLLTERPKQRIYNIVDTNHPTKEKYYSELAKKWGQRPPEFSDEAGEVYQILSNAFLDEFEMPGIFLVRL